MGEGGADIKFTPPSLFPYKIECKNQERKFTGVYDAYAQCEAHEGDQEPLLIIKMNRQKPLAIVDAEYLMKRLGEK